MCLLNVNMLVVCSVLKKVLKYFYNSDVTLACEDVSSTTHKNVKTSLQILPHTLQPLSITSLSITFLCALSFLFDVKKIPQSSHKLL